MLIWVPISVLCLVTLLVISVIYTRRTKQKIETYSEPGNIFEHLEWEYLKDDLKKTMPDSIFLKLDTRKDIKVFSVPFVEELKGDPDYGDEMIRLLKGGNWYV